MLGNGPLARLMRYAMGDRPTSPRADLDRNVFSRVKAHNSIAPASRFFLGMMVQFPQSELGLFPLIF